MSKFSKHILPTMRENPPIPFVTKLKKLEAEGANSDKVEFIRFEFLVDPSNPATRFSKEFFVFKDGSPQEYIRWLMGYRDLELLMPLKEPSDRTKMLCTMLKLKPVKTENPKKRKAESLLSTEINLTNSSDEMEEHFLFPPTISRSSTKLVENSHPTTELVVTLNVNHEEHVLRALADTGASSRIRPLGVQ
jgi:hypothetical protein